jgi:hypothetical protein
MNAWLLASREGHKQHTLQSMALVGVQNDLTWEWIWLKFLDPVQFSQNQLPKPPNTNQEEGQGKAREAKGTYKPHIAINLKRKFIIFIWLVWGVGGGGPWAGVGRYQLGVSIT